MHAHSSCRADLPSSHWQPQLHGGRGKGDQEQDMALACAEPAECGAAAVGRGAAGGSWPREALVCLQLQRAAQAPTGELCQTGIYLHVPFQSS